MIPDVEALGLKPQASARGEMIWTGNESFDQARQINGSAVKMLWESEVKMTWTNNAAHGSGRQINGPMGNDVMKDYFS